ncbi:MAG: hypothetical protein II800_08745 [Lachnospiraceae bacterium]|nr:hypothetical protein [Lachnospiraceae bacterium]
MAGRSGNDTKLKIFIAAMLILAAVLAVVLFLALGARNGNGHFVMGGAGSQSADGGGSGDGGSGKSGARKGGVKYHAASVLVDQAIEKAVQSEGGGEQGEAMREALRNMPEEDKEKVTQIVADHMDAGTISEVASDIANGDTGSVLEYAQENFSDEEMDTLRDMAEKYGYSLP